MQRGRVVAEFIHTSMKEITAKALSQREIERKGMQTGKNKANLKSAPRTIV
jgi:hypothetical protein